MNQVRIIAILFAFVLVFGCTACGGNQPETGNGDPNGGNNPTNATMTAEKWDTVMQDTYAALTKADGNFEFSYTYSSDLPDSHPMANYEGAIIVDGNKAEQKVMQGSFTTLMELHNNQFYSYDQEGETYVKDTIDTDEEINSPGEFFMTVGRFPSPIGLKGCFEAFSFSDGFYSAPFKHCTAFAQVYLADYGEDVFGYYDAERIYIKIHNGLVQEFRVPLPYGSGGQNRLDEYPIGDPVIEEPQKLSIEGIAEFTCLITYGGKSVTLPEEWVQFFDPTLIYIVENEIHSVKKIYNRTGTNRFSDLINRHAYYTEVPLGYRMSGYYSDENLSSPLDGSYTLTADTDVYVGLEKIEGDTGIVLRALAALAKEPDYGIKFIEANSTPGFTVTRLYTEGRLRSLYYAGEERGREMWNVYTNVQTVWDIRKSWGSPDTYLTYTQTAMRDEHESYGRFDSMLQNFEEYTYESEAAGVYTGASPYGDIAEIVIADGRIVHAKISYKDYHWENENEEIYRVRWEYEVVYGDDRLTLIPPLPEADWQSAFKAAFVSLDKQYTAQHRFPSTFYHQSHFYTDKLDKSVLASQLSIHYTDGTNHFYTDKVELFLDQDMTTPLPDTVTLIKDIVVYYRGVDFVIS